jgi:hypothetical protein
MRRLGHFILLTSFLILPACAPVVYSPNPGAYYEPTETYAAGSYRDRQEVSYAYEPIEVTLYAGFGASYLQTIVIHDREYVEVPVRTRRGRPGRVYAHYVRGSLHFDRDRRCNRLYGASEFRHDRGWRAGQRYRKLDLGRDFAADGIELRIRQKTAKESIKTDRYTDDLRPHIKQRRQQQRIKRDARPERRAAHVAERVLRKVIDRSSRRKASTPLKDMLFNKRHDGEEIVSAESDRKVPSGGERQLEVVRQHRRDKDLRVSVEDKLAAPRVAKRAGNRHSTSHTDFDPPKMITLSLEGGELVSAAKSGRIEASGVTLKDGDSRTLTLRTPNGIRHKLPVGYRNGRVVIGGAGRSFAADASWTDGRTYRFSDKGQRVSLRKVQVRIAAR